MPWQKNSPETASCTDRPEEPTAVISNKTNTYCSMEDIGRHNALDKCIGYALLEQLELSECILFTTTSPTDMVQKVIAAGIPVLASKAVPTDQAMDQVSSESDLQSLAGSDDLS